MRIVTPATARHEPRIAPGVTLSFRMKMAMGSVKSGVVECNALATAESVQLMPACMSQMPQKVPKNAATKRRRKGRGEKGCGADGSR